MRNLEIFANEYANFSDYNEKPLMSYQTDNSTKLSNISSEESAGEDVTENSTIILRKEEAKIRFSKISSSENKLSNSVKSIKLLRITLTTWSALFLVIDLTSWI